MIDGRLVAMTGDHGVYSRGGRIEVKVGEGMNQVQQVAAELDGFGGGQGRTGPGAVDVAPDGSNGGQIAKLVKDLRLTDIPGMENVVGAAQSVEGLGTEQAVGI